MSDIIINLATCFQYTQQSDGQLATKAKIEDYVSLIGLRVCSLVTTVNTQGNIITALAKRLIDAETAIQQIPGYQLPSLKPTGIANSEVALQLDVFVALLEEQFIQLRSATGTPTEIYNAIITQGVNFGLEKALGTTGGNLGSIGGWVMDPKTMADSVTNIWLAIKDLRNAFRNIQLALPSTCEMVQIVMTATYQNRILTLRFSGSIPVSLSNCQAEGSVFKIEDYSGNLVNHMVDVKGNLNLAAGVSIDLTSAGLNVADDIKISSVYCLSDSSLGTVCQKYLEQVVSNSTSCPTVTITSGFTTLGYRFIHGEGSVTYYIELFNSSNVMIQSQSISVTSGTVIENTFSGLTASNSYKIRLQMVTSNNTKTCPFTTASTLANPCSAPTDVTMQITY